VSDLRWTTACYATEEESSSNWKLSITKLGVMFSGNKKTRVEKHDPGGQGGGVMWVPRGYLL